MQSSKNVEEHPNSEKALIMSVQFGRWNFDGEPTSSDHLEKLESVIAPYGPDGGSQYSRSGVTILYRAFHTTEDSHRALQPYVSASGSVMTWDGRLDNRPELINQLGAKISEETSDVSIAMAAYEKYGIDCLTKFVGDWALSIWNPSDRSLILAKDPIGPRHLYYLLVGSQVTWCTVLDPLVILARKTFALDEEYVAGWLSFLPALHLTPYSGIRSVSPASYVRIQRDRCTATQYWDFQPEKRITYRTDSEYEEHFRIVFSESVRRRLRSDRPVLSELSGGVDSASIVCMADSLINKNRAKDCLLDTISYYIDGESNWNERPYFTKIEEKRGRTGCHIDLRSENVLACHDPRRDRFLATPGSGASHKLIERQFAACLRSQGNRVVLSGIGGDEVTGGVPTPIPELADLLATARIGTLARQLRLWSLNKRKPTLHLLTETIAEFCAAGPNGLPKHTSPPPWLSSGFLSRNRSMFRTQEARFKAFGPLPSFQENISTMDGLRRQLSCISLSADAIHEKRYPYLDRDLLQFLYAVPREQLVRPGQRRSLMRRALVGIVPDEVLNRKRKAYVSRTPVRIVARECASLFETNAQMLSESWGIINAQALFDAVQKARESQEFPIVHLMRTFSFERWLRNITACNVL
jgi:asparagine synthase (glutamine-hydrolysing)